LLPAGCATKPPPPVPPPPKVTVGQAVTRQVQDYREYTGWTDAVEAVEVRARVRGYLTKVYLGKDVKEGTEVKAGTPLFEIEKDQYEADLARSQADVARAEFQLKLAQFDFERTQELRQRNGAASEEEYQQRLASRDTAKAALNQAKAAEKTANDNLNYTHVTAPIAGQVGRRLVSEGNLVGYSDPTMLTTVVRTDRVYVWFDAPERDYLEYNELAKAEGIPPIEKGEVTIRVGLTTDRELYPHEGKLNFEDNRIDRGTGTITLRGLLENPNRELKSGLFARVRLPFGRAKERLMVPESAVSVDQRGPYLMIVNAENTVEYRPVKTGTVEGSLVAVVEGLKPGEWFVTKGLQMARRGAKVDPQRPGTPG
jgi:RND family efflux transporter MFP subunit